jgi:glycerate 2-kinase
MSRSMQTRLLQTKSLASHPLGRTVCGALASALTAVEPGRLVRRAVASDATGVRVGDQVHRLSTGGRIFVAGAGKAGLAMAHALVEALGDRIVDGLVAIKGDDDHDGATAVGPIRIVHGGHPVPDRRSVDAGRQLLALAGAAGPGDLVLCPISGGASSLVTVPRGDITLEDLGSMTTALLRSGASIEAMNAVRKHLDAIKGGGLALAASPATLIALVLSDVVGDPLDIVGSGPTVGDRSTFDEALSIAIEAMGAEAIPSRIRRWLEAGRSGAHLETPDPDDARLARVHNVLLAGNGTAMEAAAARAQADGLRIVGRHLLVGEACDAGRALARRLPELFGSAPAGLVAGGETTVTIRGEGIGGRNLEVALGAVEILAAMPGALLVTFATDGDDGPSGAAGAVVTSDTLARARARGLDPREHLARNDSLAFFDALGDTIRTGPTGTNVCDLALLSWNPTDRPTDQPTDRPSS